MSRRTFSLDSEVDTFLSAYPIKNKSQVVNQALKLFQEKQEEEAMARTYQEMNASQAISEFREWEEATIYDGLEND